ncbi:MipA/OmpV family protein [Pasteurella multocida]|uniref:MipA/OmpV family protein n=1 Tax=Pasteurella multocida TaxID=747 RepID=UPI003977EDCF
MKNKSKLLACCLVIFPISSFSLGNNNLIGVGVSAGNSIYHVKKNTSVTPFLAAELSFGNYYMSGAAGISEIGYRQSFTQNFTASLFINPFDGAAIKRKDLQAGYDSIQDRKKQVVVGVGLDYYLGDMFNLPNTNISLEMKKGRRGLNSHIALAHTFILTDKLSISPSLGLSYYSSKYTNYYFGIKKSELNKTKIQSVYHPKKAYSGHIALDTTYAITDHIGMGVSFSWETYSKAIKKSPIVKRGSEINSTLSFYYMF